ncbi:MAG TPA: 3-oxo-tetronate kinase, partial [Burkholderiaceae bacterium]|nr:3-oxo-tetronate kinase [Burkholderiaceae bacterium]
MLLGVIADDFTGAGDVANTLAGGGLRTTQFLGIPERADADCEAGVIALKTRSIAARDAVAQSLAALDWLRKQGCRQFLFKYCSTFDSTSAGNIGPVAEALAEELGVSGVVACPAFPAVGRRVFSGHLFVGDRLLSESSLRHHPLNPMTDSDLRRWLRQQTRGEVGFVDIATVKGGRDALRDALQKCSMRGERLVIVDAIDEADLLAIGEACADAPLVTGASGVAVGMAAALARRGGLRGDSRQATRSTGAAAILAGSCSARTLEQIERYRQSHPSMPVDPAELIEGRIRAVDAASFVLRERDAPLVYTSATPDRVAEAQRRFGADNVAHAIESFLADVAERIVADGVRRLIVAGGETSGAVVTALGLKALDVGPEIEPGVPVLQAGDRSIVLKSGNFGGIDFFEKALRAMQGDVVQPPADLAPGGVLRIGINLGNPVIAQPGGEGGEPRGVGPTLGRELARRAGLPHRFVTYDTAGLMADAVKRGEWDVAFLAVDPARATDIAFTTPYVLIEGTYIVPESSAIKRPVDADRAGHRIAVGLKTAYDLFLTREVKNATLLRSPTSKAAVEHFFESRLEAAAGVRQPLEAAARDHPGCRVLPESFMVIRQASGVPSG